MTDYAPDFALDAFRLSNELKAGAVALVFFKSSCPACQYTFPFLQRIHAANASDLRIVGVSQDDESETRAFAAEFGAGFPMILDPHPFEVSRAYGVTFVPTVVLIEKTGEVLASDYGFSKAVLDSISTRAALPSLFNPDDGIPARRPG